jgi:hypothetical protein
VLFEDRALEVRINGLRAPFQTTKDAAPHSPTLRQVAVQLEARVAQLRLERAQGLIDEIERGFELLGQPRVRVPEGGVALLVPALLSWRRSTAA